MKVYEKKSLLEGLASQCLQQEIYILALLKHESIVALHEVIDSRMHVHLVMELCEGKSLNHLLKK